MAGLKYFGTADLLQGVSKRLNFQATIRCNAATTSDGL
jgi:hypothetical protein